MDIELDDEQRTHIQALLDENKERLVTKTAEFEKIKSDLDHANDFVDNLEEHQEVAESHLTRVE